MCGPTFSACAVCKRFLPRHETLFPSFFFLLTRSPTLLAFLQKSDKFFKMNNEPVIIFDGPSVEVKKDLICFQDYFDAMMKSGYTREEAQDRYAVTAADVCRGLYVVRRDPATIGEMYFHLLVFRDLCDKFSKFLVVGQAMEWASS